MRHQRNEQRQQKGSVEVRNRKPRPTRQSELDELEMRKHEQSENELPSTQDKNPVPPGTTRR